MFKLVETSSCNRDFVPVLLEDSNLNICNLAELSTLFLGDCMFQRTNEGSHSFKYSYLTPGPKKRKMRVVQEGLVSLYSFVSGFIVPIFIMVIIHYFSLMIWGQLLITAAVSYGIINIVFFVIVDQYLMKVILRASFLGVAFFTGAYLSALGSNNLNIFGWYICVLSFFHYSEYLSIAIANPKSLSIDAFMLNHSLAYGAAAAASWIEFFIENYFVFKLKKYYYISLIGLLLCIIGELIRKSAIFTASTNFNHIVQTEKEQNHVLVTHGIYSLCRHPSYVGWFYWSIGTQLILVNPVCVLIYAAASWSFFKTRVLVEEAMLLNFFGEQYINYKKNVHSGLPCNNGVILEE